MMSGSGSGLGLGCQVIIYGQMQSRASWRSSPMSDLTGGHPVIKLAPNPTGCILGRILGRE